MVNSIVNKSTDAKNVPPPCEKKNNVPPAEHDHLRQPDSNQPVLSQENRSQSTVREVLGMIQTLLTNYVKFLNCIYHNCFKPFMKCSKFFQKLLKSNHTFLNIINLHRWHD